MILTGDLTAQDLEAAFGMPYEEYVRPVQERYATLPKGSDRNDIVRDYFNSIAGTKGARNADGVMRFYSDPDGLFCRMCAMEIGCGGTIISGLVNSGRDRFISPDNADFAFAWNTARQRFGHVAALDHGCGPCNCGLYLLSEGAYCVFYDFETPIRRAIRDGIRKYADADTRSRCAFCWKGQDDFTSYGPYNLVLTLDVLEHCIDPVDEIHKISSAMCTGGVMLMNTFFNSCGGHDPSHLDEHARFQDAQQWYDAVNAAGLFCIGNDPRGVPKVFEKR